MEKILLLTAKCIFSILFIILSLVSLETWIRGDIVYNIVQVPQDSVVFPSVTLCPTQTKNPLMNLKVGGVQKELNFSNDDVDGFAITLTLINDQYNLSDILRNFSYTKEESFTGGGGGFMLDRLNAATFVDYNDFEESMEHFLDHTDPDKHTPVPVALKEINTAFGKCFFLHNKMNATTEQKIQGWNIQLNSVQSSYEIVWQVYLGLNGLEYPTYSDLGTHDMFILQPKTDTFVSFSVEHDMDLIYRGYFDGTKYCIHEDIFSTIECKKKCFLNHLNVTCTPRALNTFDNLNLPQCPDEEDDTVLKAIFSNSLYLRLPCSHCLTPCTKHKYIFQVKNTQPSSSQSTNLRINAETFLMRGTSQQLVFDNLNLAVNIGGYLGLFIGLSLNDLFVFIVHIVARASIRKNK